MTEPTDADRKHAAELIWHTLPREQVEAVARALAERSALAADRLGGLPSNPEPGKVAFRLEAWPHDPGANGEEYVAGHMHSGEVASWLRKIADRCEKYWGDPECPWDGEPGHLPKRPPVDRSDEEAAKAAKLRAVLDENTP